MIRPKPAKSLFRRLPLPLALILVLTGLAGIGLGVTKFHQAASSSMSCPRPAAENLRTVAGWEKLYADVEDHGHDEFLAQSRSGDSWQHYNLAYGVDAATSMYRATGNTHYLDRALLYVNNVIKSAKPSRNIPTSQYHDKYLGWGSFSHPDGSDGGQEYPLYESYLWRYVAEMLRAMHDLPPSANNPAYQAQYQQILSFTEQQVFAKWADRSTDDNIYRQAPHMAAHWAYIALELSKLTPSAERRQTYEQVLTNMHHHLPGYPDGGLRGQIVRNPVNNQASFWDFDWGSHSRPGTDVSHGNAVVSYIVEAYDSRVEWTAADITGLAHLLKDVIWHADGSYAEFLDGSGHDNGWINDGFVKLGRYDADIQRRLEAYDVGQNSQFFANGALNAKYLIDGPGPVAAPQADTRQTPEPAATSPAPRRHRHSSPARHRAADDPATNGPTGPATRPSCRPVHS